MVQIDYNVVTSFESVNRTLVPKVTNVRKSKQQLTL